MTSIRTTATAIQRRRDLGSLIVTALTLCHLVPPGSSAPWHVHRNAPVDGSADLGSRPPVLEHRGDGSLPHSVDRLAGLREADPLHGLDESVPRTPGLLEDDNRRKGRAPMIVFVVGDPVQIPTPDAPAPGQVAVDEETAGGE
jgi:hypothetical protein